MSNEFEKFISENREDFDDRMPDPAVLERIHAQMNTTGKKQGILIPMKTIRWAAAACFVLIAGATIFFLQPEKPKADTPVTVRNESPIDTPVTTQNPTVPTVTLPEQKEPSIALHAVSQQKKYATAIDEQLAIQKQSLFAKLNNMQSPGQRITAAEQAYDFAGNKDRDIVDALVKTLDKDPNTNVRLAALEALSKFHREPYVKKKLTNALKTQKDPIVQIELIQMLTKMKQVSILHELEKIVDDENTMKAVKDHAYAGILNLKS